MRDDVSPEASVAASGGPGSASHAAFARYVPAARPLRGERRLLSLRLEQFTFFDVQRSYVDVLFAAGEEYHALPFVAVHDGTAVVPSAARGYGAFAGTLAGAIEQWLGSKPPGTAAQRDPTGFSPSLEAVAQTCVVPALAPYPSLFAEIDRYSIALTRARGRAVLDLHPGVGYGAAMLAAHARSLIAIAAGPQYEIARRFGLVEVAERIPAGGIFDYVLALHVHPHEVAGTLARARSAAPGALLLVSSPGREGRAALAAAGLTVKQVIPLALDRSVYYEEYLAWVGADARLTAAEPPVDARLPAAVTAAPLNVLFALRPSADKVFGGDVVQVRQTAAELERRGHRVVVSTSPRPDPAGFDLIHASNITVPDETLAQIAGIRGQRAEMPIVLMPIFTDHGDEAVWGMRAHAFALCQLPDEARLRVLLTALADRKLRLTVSGIEPPPQRSEMAPNYTGMQIEIMNQVDYLIANAYSEVHRIYRYLDCRKPFAIAPSCIDPQTYHPGRRQEFVQKYGWEDFVLSTGRVEPRKNQALLAHVMRERPDRTLIVIGKNYETWYGDLFRTYWPRNCVVLPELTEIELAGAYAAARVVVQPSWDEVVSLSALNAAACGASLVLTRNSYEHEYLRDDAYYCDPGDGASILQAIDAAWNGHARRAERRLALSARVRSEYTWEKSACLTEEAYYRFLSARAATQ